MSHEPTEERRDEAAEGGHKAAECLLSVVRHPRCLLLLTSMWLTSPTNFFFLFWVTKPAVKVAQTILGANSALLSV